MQGSRGDTSQGRLWKPEASQGSPLRVAPWSAPQEPSLCGPPCVGGSEIDENKEAVRRCCRAVETVLVLLPDEAKGWLWTGHRRRRPGGFQGGVERSRR